MRLEEIQQGATLSGVIPQQTVHVQGVTRHGSDSVELFYKDPDGKLGSRLLFREDEQRLELALAGRPWSFTADGHALRLVSEAHRIRLAHLFDPHLAIHLSSVDPLPHQITAVYDVMLPRQPLRFLLADDPGAGKTIMAGLLIRELQARGDLQRCLIVCPGVLVEQWQDELDTKFSLAFDIMTREKLEASRTGNWFNEVDLAICRLDTVSRNEELQERLQASHWDLIVVDEAHKMSASYFSGELKTTKRYRLGQALSRISRHFLLMTATPHNGKDEDFQLFLALLDGDRFEGQYRDGVHQMDATDLMRRMVKEELLTMEGKKLFPPRFAHVAPFALSPHEAALYHAVTTYVRDEFQRVDRMLDEGRKRTVGFALTVLQRRLASSPEAIYQSLVRRRKRLQDELAQQELLRRGAAAREMLQLELPRLSADEVEDLDDAPAAEVEEREEQITDLATAAQTIVELQLELQTLDELIALAERVRASKQDSKWVSLATVMEDDPEIRGPGGLRRKMVIFTEHKDTLRYLEERLGTLLGSPESIVTIHGSMGREERKKSEIRFKTDPTALILLATDAAGEGINLQIAHLMVNYDLPWNPNRIEQRFGRIHRIGQAEPCHLWNMIASETIEGHVYQVLLEKLETQRAVLGDKVFDVLGQVTFGANRSLRDLILDGIRQGESPEVRARQQEVVELGLDQLEALLADQALTHDVIETRRVQEIRHELARAEAMRLQPRYIASFFQEAFTLLGGQMHQRESERFEVTHVPVEIRRRDREIGTREVVSQRYARITFDKALRRAEGKPPAEFVCPGHPLLEATSDLIRERYGSLLRAGALLVNPADLSETCRWLVYLRHEVHGGHRSADSKARLLSARLQFVVGDLVPGDNEHPARIAGWEAAGLAPYLDYRPLTEAEQRLCEPFFAQPIWDLRPCEEDALSFAIRELVEPHLTEVRNRRLSLLDKTWAAVKARLTYEIARLDHRAEQLREDERRGKQTKLPASEMERRASDLRDRLARRQIELESAREIWPEAPLVLGGALIVPQGLLDRLAGSPHVPDTFARETARVEALAMQAVMQAERAAGRLPTDVSAQNRGYDIESLDLASGDLLFLEVKGRVSGAPTVTVTRNEQLTAMNAPDRWRLALVEVDGESTTVRYVREPFDQLPGFAETSSNFNWKQMWEQGEEPR